MTRAITTPTESAIKLSRYVKVILVTSVVIANSARRNNKATSMLTLTAGSYLVRMSNYIILTGSIRTTSEADPKHSSSAGTISDTEAAGTPSIRNKSTSV